MNKIYIMCVPLYQLLEQIRGESSTISATPWCKQDTVPWCTANAESWELSRNATERTKKTVGITQHGKLANCPNTERSDWNIGLNWNFEARPSVHTVPLWCGCWCVRQNGFSFYFSIFPWLPFALPYFFSELFPLSRTQTNELIVSTVKWMAEMGAIIQLMTRAAQSVCVYCFVIWHNDFVSTDVHRC